jgi:DNA-binding transcriptional LysR family regulator
LLVLNANHLKTFLVVLRTGTFADAGRELGYTASAVSQQMVALERSAGITLFERSASAVKPTAAAESLGPAVQDVLASINHVVARAAELARGERGRLRLSTFSSAGARLVPQALQAFLRQRPGVEVLLDEGEPQELIPRLLAGERDAILVYEYSSLPHRWPPAVVRHEILVEQLLLLVPASWDVARDPRVDLRQLDGATFASSAEGTAGAASLERLCAAEGYLPRIEFRSNNYDTITGIVASALAAALVPTLGYRPRPGVVATALDLRRASRKVFALHRSENQGALIRELVMSLRHAAASL